MRLAVRRGHALVRHRDVFDHLFGDDWFFRPGLVWRDLAAERLAAPPVDVQETDDDVIVTASLPGYKPEEISVTFEDGALVIEATDDHEASDGNNGSAPRQRSRGRLYHRVSLPVRTTTENAQARTDNGILTIQVPKSPEAKTTRIKVEAA